MHDHRRCERGEIKQLNNCDEMKYRVMVSSIFGWFTQRISLPIVNITHLTSPRNKTEQERTQQQQRQRLQTLEYERERKKGSMMFYIYKSTRIYNI